VRMLLAAITLICAFLRADDTATLLHRDLTPPIAGLKPKDIQDTFNTGRGGGNRHEATDIPAPRGTPVLAMTDGEIRKLFYSERGGITIYEFDPDEMYCFYYAHLDRYASGLKEGMHVRRGDVIGYVGTTGDTPANAPHLHLAVTKLGPDKKWWEGTPINPYPILMQLVMRTLGNVVPEGTGGVQIRAIVHSNAEPVHQLAAQPSGDERQGGAEVRTSQGARIRRRG
jgi:Peptidase family M23